PLLVFIGVLLAGGGGTQVERLDVALGTAVEPADVLVEGARRTGTGTAAAAARAAAAPAPAVPAPLVVLVLVLLVLVGVLVERFLDRRLDGLGSGREVDVGGLVVVGRVGGTVE